VSESQRRSSSLPRHAASPDSFPTATKSYEQWLGRQTNLLQGDLKEKHELMKEGPFPFLRATFYRWVQIWAELCPLAADAPATHSVGDVHVENYGTWRDREGRLAWGINDFDEACLLPYTHDLIRLATSGLLGIAEGRIRGIRRREVCAAILDGYETALERGPAPIVLAEDTEWLRDLAAKSLNDPDRFWSKLKASRSAAQPRGAELKDLKASLPSGSADLDCFGRAAGMGSRGRRRFVAIAQWNGAQIAREIKAFAPSAWEWANGKPSPTSQSDICAASIRSLDPTYGYQGPWIVRRLAPDCAKVELDALPGPRHQLRLLRAMGRELANVHAGTHGGIEAVRGDWSTRKHRHPDWLEDSARPMVESVRTEWKKWCS
jgi:Uncharacterized protein conserved in bacteria (DUF2252)